MLSGTRFGGREFKFIKKVLLKNEKKNTQPRGQTITHLLPIFSRLRFIAKSVSSELQNCTNASPVGRPLLS